MNEQFIIVYVAAVLVFIRRFKKWELENPFDGASLLSRKKYSRQKVQIILAYAAVYLNSPCVPQHDRRR